MSQKISVFVAVSLDGFIARTDGDLDWLHVANLRVPQDEDFGYYGLVESADALVMGRQTYEAILGFGDWPHMDKKVIVLSHRPIDFRDDLPASMRQMQGTPSEISAQLASEGFQHLYIDGGETIQQFLQAGLITDLTITVIPTLIGSGIRLFGNIDEDIELELESSESYECGYVQLKYRLPNESTDEQTASS